MKINGKPLDVVNNCEHGVFVGERFPTDYRLITSFFPPAPAEMDGYLRQIVSVRKGSSGIKIIKGDASTKPPATSGFYDACKLNSATERSKLKRCDGPPSTKDGVWGKYPEYLSRLIPSIKLRELERLKEVDYLKHVWRYLVPGYGRMELLPGLDDDDKRVIWRKFFFDSIRGNLRLHLMFFIRWELIGRMGINENFFNRNSRKLRDSRVFPLEKIEEMAANFDSYKLGDDNKIGFHMEPKFLPLLRSIRDDNLIKLSRRTWRAYRRAAYVCAYTYALRILDEKILDSHWNRLSPSKLLTLMFRGQAGLPRVFMPEFSAALSSIKFESESNIDIAVQILGKIETGLKRIHSENAKALMPINL